MTSREQGGRRALVVQGIDRKPAEAGAEHLQIRTDAGTITCRLHDSPYGDVAVLWVFGAGGGLGGPAGGVYARLGRQLTGEGIVSLELDYRRPAQLHECVLDVFAGIEALATLGRRRVVLVGHSFGGAVVITAGALREEVIAVAALSSQSYGSELAKHLSPRPLLVAHGQADEVLSDACSRDIYRRAKEPKQLILYPGCRHGLDQCREELDRDLLAWLRNVTGVDAIDQDVAS